MATASFAHADVARRQPATTHRPSTAPAPGGTTRLACACAALAVTGFVTASLLGLFHQASPSRWLAPTPELMELVSACQALPGGVERRSCTKAVVAAYRERLDRGLVLAESR